MNSTDKKIIIKKKGDQKKVRVESINLTHNRWRGVGSLVGRGGVLRVLGQLVVQDIFLDHFEITVLARDISVFQGYEDGVAIFSIEPVFGLQGGIGSRRVWVQVVLKQVRLTGGKVLLMIVFTVSY